MKDFWSSLSDIFACSGCTGRGEDHELVKPSALAGKPVPSEQPVVFTAANKTTHSHRRRWGCPCQRRAAAVELDPADLVTAHSEASHAVAREAAAFVKSRFLKGEAWWVQKSDAQRMLVATEGDVHLAKSKLCDAVKWRERTLETWLASDGPRETRIIAHGREQRPLCYLCAAHQRSGDVLAAHWACAWQRAIAESKDPFVQIDQLMDCSGFQVLLNLSLRQYMQLAPSADSYFAERIHWLIVLDFPVIAQFLWKAVKPLLPAKTQEKVKFINRHQPETMAILDELAVDAEMREMLDELLRMNKEATPQTGRERSHAFTERFLRRQGDKNGTDVFLWKVS